tara:strand:- start:316 stop:960 length:645 start_codon:yes stop_codon:yes gene_type:complete
MIHSSAQIHSTVILDGDNIVIGSDVKIGPYTFIGNNVEIQSNTHIYNNVTIGTDAQHIKNKEFEEEPKKIIIGKNTIIREYATVHMPTTSGLTKVGDDCYLMATCHVAHDCRIGNHVILANSANLGGHTEVGDYTYISLNVSVHQFSKIGRYCLIAANAFFKGESADGVIWGGVPSKPLKVNNIGIDRNILNQEESNNIKNIAKEFLSNFNDKK